jgi:hypothetical protein
MESIGTLPGRPQLLPGNSLHPVFCGVLCYRVRYPLDPDQPSRPSAFAPYWPNPGSDITPTTVCTFLEPKLDHLTSVKLPELRYVDHGVLDTHVSRCLLRLDTAPALFTVEELDPPSEDPLRHDDDSTGESLPTTAGASRRSYPSALRREPPRVLGWLGRAGPKGSDPLSTLTQVVAIGICEIFDGVTRPDQFPTTAGSDATEHLDGDLV